MQPPRDAGERMMHGVILKKCQAFHVKSHVRTRDARTDGYRKTSAITLAREAVRSECRTQSHCGLISGVYHKENKEED